MADGMSLNDICTAWSMAKRKAELFARDIKTEDRADEQLLEQQACLKGAAQTRASNLEDVLVKFEMFRCEISGHFSDFHELPAEIELMTSLERDLKYLVEKAARDIAA